MKYRRRAEENVQRNTSGSGNSGALSVAGRNPLTAIISYWTLWRDQPRWAKNALWPSRLGRCLQLTLLICHQDLPIWHSLESPKQGISERNDANQIGLWAYLEGGICLIHDCESSCQQASKLRFSVVSASSSSCLSSALASLSDGL